MAKSKSRCCKSSPEKILDDLSSRALKRRYSAILKSATLPSLTLKEVEAAFWMFKGQGVYLFGDPQRFLIQRCQEVRWERSSDWEMYKDHLVSNNIGYDPDDEFDHVPYEDLQRKFSIWSDLQCLKFIEIMQEFLGQDYYHIEVVPATIHAFIDAMGKSERIFVKEVDWNERDLTPMSRYRDS